jgi:hypothetical protein
VNSPEWAKYRYDDLDGAVSNFLNAILSSCCFLILMYVVLYCVWLTRPAIRSGRSCQNFVWLYCRAIGRGTP